MIYSLAPDFRLKLDGIPEDAPGFRIEEEFTAGVGIVRLEFARPPQPFRICWSVPQHDIQFRWSSVAGKIGENYPQFLPPAWLNAFSSEFTRNAPLFALVGANGRNRLTVAASDAKNRLEFFAGVSEESFELECRLECSMFPETGAYRLELRFDRRDLPFETTLAGASAWWEEAYPPLPAPPAAREPVYSTWYSYHRAVNAQAVEAEAAASRQYGLHTVIVDDGWQETGDAAGYGFAGTWEIDRARFPDMAAHVARIQAADMNYLLWIAPPFVGETSGIFPELKGKMLYFASGLNCWIVDPRFPEVRERLIGRCVELAASLKLDGLKIDFLDRFILPPGTEDPAEKDGFAGRDCKAVPEGVFRLLTELTARLRRLSDRFLIEYRQDYIGPGMRELANIFRASDCPGDRIANRRRIVNLRLLSGSTAVHSDMLGWHPAEPVESAARQIWNIIFSVPQISVRLETLPEKHRRMLRFLLEFHRKHSRLLLAGTLRAPHPELNYPCVTAEDETGSITVVYQENQLIALEPETGKTWIVGNASTSPDVYFELAGTERTGRIFDCLGNNIEEATLAPGMWKIVIPPSGFLVIPAE